MHFFKNEFNFLHIRFTLHLYDLSYIFLTTIHHEILTSIQCLLFQSRVLSIQKTNITVSFVKRQYISFVVGMSFLKRHVYLHDGTGTWWSRDDARVSVNKFCNNCVCMRKDQLGRSNRILHGKLQSELRRCTVSLRQLSKVCDFIINRYVIYGYIIGTRAICRYTLRANASLYVCIETSRGQWSWWREKGGWVGNICRALILIFAIGYLRVNRNFPVIVIVATLSVASTIHALAAIILHLGVSYITR